MSFKKKLFSYLLLSSMLLFPSLPAQAIENNASQALENILANLKSIRADFEQTILDGKGRPLQTAQGKMALQRPGKFRWEIVEPVKQLIITNDQKVWIYDQDLEQVTVQNLAKSMGNAPAMLLLGETASLTKSYRISAQPPVNSGQWFILIPKDKDSLFQKLQLHFINNNQLDEMQLSDSIGHKTYVKLSNAVINSEIAPSMFRFVVPKGVDVINN